MFYYLLTVFTFTNFSALVVGVLVGLVIGAIPGLNPAMAIALMIPVTFHLQPETALIMLTSVYAAGIYGGSFSAILMRAPGTSASAATAIEGWELTVRGKAMYAIRIATFASVVGGLLSGLVLLLAAPPAAKIALWFQPSEYFLVAILGLISIASVSFQSTTKGLISGFLGIAISTIGIDIHTGFPRYIFGFPPLEGGIGIIPAIIGLFAFAQALSISTGQASETITISGEKPKLSWNLLPKFSEIMELKGPLIRGWITGLIVGIIPAAGGSIAQWIAYGEEIRRSKPGDQFGKGEIKGLAACEGANNSTTGTSMIPLFVLGIPGGISAAVIFGALMIHGLNPGMGLFTKTPHVVYPVMWGFMIANIVMGVVAIFIARVMMYITHFPRGILSPLILVFCVVGVYTSSANIYDVWIMCSFGLIGYLMNRFGFVPAGMLLGIILGPICENALRNMITVSNGSPITYMVSRPLSIVLIIMIIAALYFSIQQKKRASKAAAKEQRIAQGVDA